jgi:hypothetical protein
MVLVPGLAQGMGPRGHGVRCGLCHLFARSGEVILGLSLKTLTNYTNALARTPPNAEFGEAVWRHRA